MGPRGLGKTFHGNECWAKGGERQWDGKTLIADIRLVRATLVVGWSTEVVGRLQERTILFSCDVEAQFSSFICLSELIISLGSILRDCTSLTQHNTRVPIFYTTSRRTFLKLPQPTNAQVHTFVRPDGMLTVRTPPMPYPCAVTGTFISVLIQISCWIGGFGMNFFTNA